MTFSTTLTVLIVFVGSVALGKLAAAAAIAGIRLIVDARRLQTLRPARVEVHHRSAAAHAAARRM